MINIPTTDILTLITGEVEKPAMTDHSETAEVSFQSVIAAEDADMAALIEAPDQQKVGQKLRPPQTDHAGLAMAFPAFITVPDTVSDSVVLAQMGQPFIPNQLASPPTPPTLLAPIMDGDSGDADQIVTATPLYAKDSPRNELGTVPRPIADGPVIGKEGVENVRHPAETKVAFSGNILAGQPANDVSVPAQNNSAAPATQTSADSAASAKRNAPIAAPINAVLLDAPLPKMTAGPSKEPLPVVDTPKTNTASQEKPAFTQQTPFAAQAQSRPIEPMNIRPQHSTTVSVGDRAIAAKPEPTPIQAPVMRLTQAPTVDLPVNRAVSDTPAREQKIAHKTDLAQPSRSPTSATPQPSLSSVSATPQPQIRSEAATRAATSQGEIQTPVQGRQSQTKQPRLQSTEAAPTQPVQPLAAQPQPIGVTPQATLSPTIERHAIKPNSPPTPVSQNRTPSRNNSTEATPKPIVASPVPTAETATIGAFEPLSTPEFMSFEAKSAEITSILRQDVNLNRPEVMRHVAQQLTDVARQMPDRPVELALNPEELGRVRLTFTTTDGGIHIAVMAERGETMDLLRRHIETLAQEFRELGYKDVKFEFSQNGQNDAQNGEADAQNSADPDATPAQTQSLAPVQLSLEPSAGLDLRL